jgi:transposase
VGYRRRFSDADRSRIVAETVGSDANVSAVARRYGISRRVLCRWRQEQAAAVRFVDVTIVEGPETADEVMS